LLVQSHRTQLKPYIRITAVAQEVSCCTWEELRLSQIYGVAAILRFKVVDNDLREFIRTTRATRQVARKSIEHISAAEMQLNQVGREQGRSNFDIEINASTRDTVEDGVGIIYALRCSLHIGLKIIEILLRSANSIDALPDLLTTAVRMGI
jgi:hypothetical protein